MRSLKGILLAETSFNVGLFVETQLYSSCLNFTVFLKVKVKVKQVTSKRTWDRKGCGCCKWLSGSLSRVQNTNSTRVSALQKIMLLFKPSYYLPEKWCLLGLANAKGLHHTYMHRLSAEGMNLKVELKLNFW